MFLCLVTLPDQIFLLLRRKVAPPKLILANPGKGFVAVAELLFMGAEPDARMRLRDAAASLKNAIPPLKYWHLILNGKKRTARVVLSAATPTMTQICSVARETAYIAGSTPRMNTGQNKFFV